MRGFNIALDGYSILICLVLLIDQLSHVSAGLRQQRKWFLLLLAANIGMSLGDMSDWALSGQTDAASVCLLRGGTLRIRSTENGTAVTIRIPKGKEQNDEISADR